MPRFRFVFILLAMLLTSPPASAQGSAGKPFVDVIDVRVVNLEVVVVDRRGQRVSGLDPADFRLRVDKREMPIDYFSEISEGVAVGKQAAPAAPAVPGLVAGRSVGTSYLVFIDELFTRSHHRNRVLQEMLPELTRLGPEDRMAVVAFNGRKIEMLSSWSRSPGELQEIFRQAMRRRSRGLHTAAETRGVEIGSLPGPRDENLDASLDNSLDDSLDNYIDSKRLENHLERIALAVTATLRSFAKAPGRKVMMLLAGPWPYNFSDNLTYDSSRGGRILQPIWETANLLGYTLYPVDVGGSQLSPGAGQRALRSLESFASSAAIEAHATFEVMAEETGGRALIDGARLSAFDRVIEDTRSYYWLGFTPDWQGNDKSHDIRLEVTRPGLKVRTRESFRDLSREKEVSFIVESALMFGDLPGAVPLRVSFGEPSKKRRLLVPLTLFIPMDEITMIHTGERYEAHLELRIAALDGSGGRNQVAVIPVLLFGDRPPPPGVQAVYETAIRMRNREHDLVVSLHDPLSGTIFAAIEKHSGAR